MGKLSGKGRLTFYYRLLDELPDTRSKFIVHELMHLKYPNRGKIFKTLYNTYLKKVGINCSIDDCGLLVRMEKGIFVWEVFRGVKKILFSEIFHV
jgi:hypothetical protein